MLLSVLATGTIAYYDLKASKGKDELDMVRELARSRSVIEESVNRYFTLVNALEAFVLADKGLYKLGDSATDDFDQRFQRFAFALEQENASIISLQLAPKGIVTYVSKLEKNAKAVGHDLLKNDDRREQVIKTITNKTTVVAGPLKLIQGGNAIIARKAIFTEAGSFRAQEIFDRNRAPEGATWPSEIPNDFWGFATMLIDTDLLFEEFGLDRLPKNFEFALRGRHGLGEKGEVFWGEASVFTEPNYTTKISLPGGSWVMGIARQSQGYPLRVFIIILTGLTLSGFGIHSLYARQKKLDAESEAKTHGRFLATMSHEIRTPMNGIIGVAEVMRNSELTTTQKGQLDKILNSGKVLLRLVNDILDFSKIDAGSFVLEKQPFNPKKVLLSAHHAVEVQAQEKGVSIALMIDPNFPEATEGDEIRLQQVLVNLLSNAVKFTEQGSVKVKARLAKDGSNQYLRFEVKDSGIGMSENELARIFSPFTQADQSITRKFGGTGLGLVICDKIVTLMQGNISVTSKKGRGSKFVVRIPYIPVNEKVAEQLLEPPKSEAISAEEFSTQATKTDLKILVVDDQLINIEVAAMILEQLGYECARASSGHEAINLIKHGRFDIVYMDRQMPEMDGLEATSAIRKITKSDTYPWIVALTASAQQEEKAEYLAAGANDFVSKPVNIESFTKSIQKYLDQAVEQ
jgi:signal transduction histidine kinase/ActR/RegA family two-component response regulator